MSANSFYDPQILGNYFDTYGEREWQRLVAPRGQPADYRYRDITPQTYPGRQDNFMHLFRSSELRVWLEAAGLEVLALSASGCLAWSESTLMENVRGNPQVWEELLRMELEASSDQGCLDMGTHLIAAARFIPKGQGPRGGTQRVGK